MAGKALSWIGIAMGVIIFILDVYWTYVARVVPMFLAIGAIIAIADLVWIGTDAVLMKRG